MPWALPASLPIVILETGATVDRIHWPDSPEPFFGPPIGRPPSHRFHDPEGVFRVCFFGENASACFVETLLRRPGTRLVTLLELSGRQMTTFRVTRPVRLAQLSGAGLAQCGCTAEITSSRPPYAEPQALARAIWAHADEADGIHYRCRHDNDLTAIALFDRAQTALQRLTTESLVADRSRLLDWSRRYGFAIG